MIFDIYYKKKVAGAQIKNKISIFLPYAGQVVLPDSRIGLEQFGEIRLVCCTLGGPSRLLSL
jgi:hypothetical protein